MAKRMRVEAPSQEKEHDADGREPVATQTVASQTEPTALEVETQRVQAEFSADRDRVSELRMFFYKFRHSTSVQTVVEAMPQDLRTWLTGRRSKK